MERQIKKEDLLFKVIGKDQAKWYQPTPIKFDLGRYTPEEIAELRIEAYNLEIKHNIKDQTSKENSIKSGLLRKDQVKNPNSLTQGQFCCMNLNTSRGSQAIPGVFIPIQHIIQGSKLSFPPLSNYMPALPTKSQFKDTGKIKIPEKSPLELDTQTDVIREENPNKIIDLKENTHQKKVNPSEVIEISDSSESEGSTCNLNSNLQIIVPGHDKPQGSEKEDLTTRTSLLSNQHKMNLLSPHKLLVKKDRKESYQKSTGESADTPRGFQPIKRGFQVFRPSSNIEENQRLSSIFGNKPFKIIKERKPEKPCTENMEAIILSNPQKYMSRPQDEEFAVQLKMDDSDDDSELYRNAIDFSMPAKQPDPQQEVTEIKPESMSEYILKLIETRRKTQALIDEGNFIKRGPGRNRKSKFPTTEKVKKLINEFFIKGFEKLNMNKYNNTRTDA